ncbi:FAD-dependent oxidoreductase [Paraliomyxa miuraensis]|uniref:FAD-dependent oxidoreductase n=1 Tax=Paraliomyxa miuraensis TaxID=376150 RepID=UPI0022525215|nr:NAD(P)/FAD-dependent oxidoreductase [Paraliomyxa miuraensis]MCX4242928.1 FAD-dependent monooxygenase [Paraliomyxa miuraensis]
MQSPIDVGIVGAGTAGTASALLLARAGHRVTLYERVPEPGPVGAGIVLQPTGQAVLERLGLLQPVLERGARIDRLRCVTARGRPVFALDYLPVGEPARGPAGVECFGLGLHRGVLHQTLLQTVRAQPGIELRCGVDIDAPLLERDHVALRTAAGERLGPHDVVVVADGARSQLRAGTGLRFSESPYEWGALWYVGDDADGVYAGELFQVVRGTSFMMGLLPTGRGPQLDSPPDVSLFWSIRTDRLEAFRTGDLQAWKDEVQRHDPRAAFLLEQIRSHEQLLFAHYRHISMPRWHGERIVFIGDAAHAMSPQLGQGCNLALVDATGLADAIAAAPSPTEALALYTRLRRDHLRYYLWATRAVTPFFQSDHEWLGWLRDRFMPLLTMIPWIRRQMCLSMAGHMRGVLRSPLSLAALATTPALPPAPDA